jgi:cation diffusion facilitator family transporter
MFDAIATARQIIRPLLRRGAPEYASMISLIACIILAAVSLVLGLMQRSLIVQTNGYITLIDIGNSLLFLAAVQRSMRDPDMTFNYGYGKYESLAILVSANLLIVLTIITVGEAIVIFQRPPDDRNTIVLLVWSAVSFLIMRFTGRLLTTYANRFHMPMLKYDAELWRVDSWMEIGVFASLIVSGALHYVGEFATAAVIDGVVSVGMLIVAIKVPLKHGADAFRQLLDRTLPDAMQYEILAVIADNHDRMCEFKSVHTRQSGKDIFIEIDLVMPYDYTLERLYLLEADILKGLRVKFPTAIPRVYVTPCDRQCERAGASGCPVKRAIARSTESA